MAASITGQCLLCEQVRELQLGHIIPSFVIKWHKRSAPGFVRSNRDPNQRAQDGPKDHLLCWDCEQIVGEWENQFRDGLFIPLHDPEPITKALHYGPWAIKCAISISMRVLAYYLRNHPEELNEDQRVAAGVAIAEWRRFLRGEIENPGPYEQHLLPVDVVENHTIEDPSPYLNRYLIRAVGMDVLSGGQPLIVYAKLCRLLLFGFAREPNPKHWKGTRMAAKGGVIVPQRYVLPIQILDYMNARASEVADTMKTISPTQREKIAKTLKDRPGKLGKSELARAMQADFIHTGEAALQATEPKDFPKDSGSKEGGRGEYE